MDPARQAAAASVFTVSNGYVGVRGVLEEQGSAPGPATLMAAAYELRPHSYAEPAYGYPETDEVLVPVADCWAMELEVDGRPAGDGTLTGHERVLDLRTGVLERDACWTSPSGGRVRLVTRRLASLTRREVVTASYEVRAEDAVEVTLRSVRWCDARTSLAARADDQSPVVLTDRCVHSPDRSWLRQRVPSSHVEIHVVADRTVEAADGVVVEPDTTPHRGGVTARLEAGQWLRVVQTVAYTASAGAGALEEGAHQALDQARAVGWDGLLTEQRSFLAGVHRRGDVVVDGDPELQQAARFALFQVVQASAGADGLGIRSKGLTGTGYHGHTFWDADTFVVPVLDRVLPEASAQHLRWRHSTLPRAVRRARELDLEGAAFPWRTISGAECSGYWPAGTAAFHVTADVADAAVRHLAVTGDDAFATEVAVDLVVHAARLWCSLGYHVDGTFRLDGLTGPDEYSALADNNTYTNLMARRNLRAAVDLTQRLPGDADRLGVTEAERLRWTGAADAMVVPTDPVRGVTEQAEGFTRHALWDFDAMDVEDYPLEDHVWYGSLYRRQVVKQADLVLALYLAGDEFTAERKRRDFDYYEPLTVRDSTLSAAAQAVVAAEVGHLDLAYAYARETALVDLRDLDRTTDEGLHIAALAGAWTALVAGFGGLRDADGVLHLRPRLPDRLTGLRFRLVRGQALLEVAVSRDAVDYRLVDGPAVDVVHDGHPLRLTTSDPHARLPLEPIPATTPPRQPPGREPRG